MTLTVEPTYAVRHDVYEDLDVAVFTDRFDELASMADSVSFFTDANNILRIGSLDVNFEQHSKGETPALFGHFVFQSSAAVPEPTSFALLGLGIMGPLAIRRKTRAMSRS